VNLSISTPTPSPTRPSRIRPLLLLACALLARNAAADLSLHYDQPAPDTPQGWEQQALPIGNGRLGAMLFGQVARDRLQFNDITLWTGDDRDLGAFQPFGDAVLTLDGADAPVTQYRRELDIRNHCVACCTAC